MIGDGRKSDQAALLVLSLCDGPVSVDSLIDWGIARPKDLWRVLEEGRRSGVIVEHVETGPGTFVWGGDEEKRSALWREASIEDWQRSLVHPDIVRPAVERALRAGEPRDRARDLFRALVNVRQPELFPGSEKGFLRVVIESCRLFAHAEWRPAEAVDRGILIAEQAGDRTALSFLLGIRSSIFFLYEGNLEKSIEYVTRAYDIAATLDNPEMTRTSGLGLSLIRILSGEFRAGIEAFENLLGNVPQEILPALESMYPEDAMIALETVGTIANAYAVVGQPARAVDLLHRAEALGVEKGREDIVRQARLYLCLIGVETGDFEYARRHGQAVLDYWRGEGDRPLFVWFAATMVSLLHRADGRLDEARAVLAAGHEARLRAVFPYVFGGEIFNVLEWLKENGAAPIEGLTLETEIERYLGWHSIRMRGLAHLARARCMLDSGAPGEVETHLGEAETLLRRTGAAMDLARLLEERAAWDERKGRPREAGERRREAGDLRRSVPALAHRGASRGREAEEKAFHVVEIGRLFQWGERPASWGEIAARLCLHFSAERAVIVEARDPPCLLGARGGSAAWVEAVLKEIGACEREKPAFLAPPRNAEDRDDRGRLVVVPFSCRNTRRQGWVGLENRRTRPMLGPEDGALLDVLSAQVSVLIENATLWQELQSARARLEQENRYYREMDRTESGAGSIVGRSPALRQALDLVARVAPTDSTVLITGETGVGKELVAREIHRLSPRSGGPFIPVHIASLAPGLVASSLFGHERGAFTGATEQVRGRFELAHGGTLLLDEVGELGPEEQVRLLRVLQEGTFERVGGSRPIRSDFRLVAATNRDLGVLVKSGRFREDLFYRLDVFPVCVPPLRDRAEDIPMLALFFMEQCARRLGRSFDGIGEADMARLQAYPWPGNVRELMHLIERAAVLSDGPRLRIPPLAASDAAPPRTGPVREGEQWVSLAEAERRYIRSVLQHVRGRLTGSGGAAEILGLKPSTLHFKLKKLGLRADLARSRRARRESG